MLALPGQATHGCRQGFTHGFVLPVTASLIDSKGPWVVVVNVSGKGLVSGSRSFHMSVLSGDSTAHSWWVGASCCDVTYSKGTHLFFLKGGGMAES